MSLSECSEVHSLHSQIDGLEMECVYRLHIFESSTNNATWDFRMNLLRLNIESILVHLPLNLFLLIKSNIKCQYVSFLDELKRNQNRKIQWTLLLDIRCVKRISLKSFFFFLSFLLMFQFYSSGGNRHYPLVSIVGIIFPFHSEVSRTKCYQIHRSNEQKPKIIVDWCKKPENKIWNSKRKNKLLSFYVYIQTNRSTLVLFTWSLDAHGESFCCYILSSFFCLFRKKSKLNEEFYV